MQHVPVLRPLQPSAEPVMWLRGPAHDLAMAFLWVPFALIAHVARHDPESLRTVVVLTLVFSFTHQPLTLWLVYGDAAQRRSHRSLVVWAPLVVALAVALASATSPGAVAVVAGIWNLAHTLRQRYGVCKLYGRLSGIDCGADNRLLWSWMALAVIVAHVHTDLGAAARSIGLGQRNTTAIDVIASADAVISALLPAAALAFVVMTSRWVGSELRRRSHSVARLSYLASTAGLLVVVAVEPVAGFVGYVGAHAAEYFFVVRWRVGRAAQRRSGGDAVGAVARRIGSGGTLVLYAIAVVPLAFAIRHVDGGTLASTAVLTLGGLHLLFDGVIWRSPSTSVPVRT